MSVKKGGFVMFRNRKGMTDVPYEVQIEQAAHMIEEADYILVGAGAGVSAAAGIASGKDFFRENFGEFIEKYSGPYMQDMYSAGFYPFPTEEAKWGYWSKHALMGLNGGRPAALYGQILRLLTGKNYFVLTTNVDEQFPAAGVPLERIFATQGSYGKIQCRRGCHPETYDGMEIFRQMDQARENCCIPSHMVPKCPVCGGPMEMNLRCDNHFVQDEAWYRAQERFNDFLQEALDSGKNVCLLEMGTGFNTPAIIRFPFEKLVREHENVTLLRLNLNEAIVPESPGARAVGINADIKVSIGDLLRVMQEERLNYLLEAFKKDSVQYRDLKVGDAYEEKRMALRSLMNIRMPRKMQEDVLKVQDDFLKTEGEEKGIVRLEDIPTIEERYGSRHPFADKISVWQGDITRLGVGAIVNAANSQMLGCFVPCHKCIDNAIHSAAGIQLRAECNCQMNQKKIRRSRDYKEPTGQAMLTKGYNLPAEYVIHTVGPIVDGQLTDALRQDLRNCYGSVMNCCVENNIRSVAFCCISTGEFRFPNEEAAKIAADTVTELLKVHGDAFDRVIFNVFKDVDLKLYERLLRD